MMVLGKPEPAAGRLTNVKMPSRTPTRRALIRSAGGLALPALLRAAPPFWNRKKPAEWSPDEIMQLLTRSPWARETNIDFEMTEGGHLELPSGGGAPGQEGQLSSGRGQVSDPTAGSMRRAPVLVRWESAQPIQDAGQSPSIQGLIGRYVISVTNIPPGVMNRPRRGARGGDGPTQEDLLAELQGAATLESPGRDPAGAGAVRHMAGSENNYLFGFSRELLLLNGAEKEVTFVLHTARVSVKAKFEPRNMMYRGKLAL
jgi:hypothetical protein